MTCFECESTEEIHLHHVVPRSLGGTRTVPLCGRCHSLVHSKDLTRIGTLTSKAMKRKIRRAEYVGGKVPYGFRNVNGRLVVDAEELDIVRQARELRAGGLTLQAVASELAERGLLSRTGKVFHHDSIRAMVASPPPHIAHLLERAGVHHVR